jgi:hypothetical protein
VAGLVPAIHVFNHSSHGQEVQETFQEEVDGAKQSARKNVWKKDDCEKEISGKANNAEKRT